MSKNILKKVQQTVSKGVGSLRRDDLLAALGSVFIFSIGDGGSAVLGKGVDIFPLANDFIKKSLRGCEALGPPATLSPTW